MTDNDIDQLVEEHKKYGWPDALMEKEFALGLVESDDPMFLLKVPEPWRTSIIEFGKSVDDQWYVISNNGMLDYSKHAKALNRLVIQFLHEGPEKTNGA